MTRFLVLAARRSGVTLLIDCLNSHPAIHCKKGGFDLVNRLRYVQVDRPDSEFRAFRSTSLERRLSYLLRRGHLVERFMESLLVPEDGVSAKGFRVAYNQALKYPQILRWALKRDVSIVHLVRSNCLKTLVSEATTHARRVYHSTSEVKKVRVHLPPWWAKRRLRKLSSEIDHYRSIVSRARHIEVSYEDFVADREAQSRRLLEFLGVEERPLASQLRKLNPDSLDQIIENYDELRASLNGTRFERYFEAAPA